MGNAGLHTQGCIHSNWIIIITEKIQHHLALKDLKLFQIARKLKTYFYNGPHNNGQLWGFLYFLSVTMSKVQWSEQGISETAFGIARISLRNTSITTLLFLTALLQLVLSHS